jgi:hypothetical protein
MEEANSKKIEPNFVKPEPNSVKPGRETPERPSLPVRICEKRSAAISKSDAYPLNHSTYHHQQNQGSQAGPRLKLSLESATADDQMTKLGDFVKA